MLFYRKDLLQKYSVAVPKTWDELDAAAKKIVDGEKGSNPNLQGFVFQGNAYEGLTCNALEWIASSGGGTLLDGKNVTFNNPQAVAILNKAKGWVGTSAPKGVTSYQEDETAQAFTGGNAVFVRNWPYMYQLAQEAAATKDKFDVAPLPVTGTNPPVGTLGGWQLGVSKFSKAQDAAIEFVRYMTSEEISKFRAVNGTYVPLYQSVADDPDVQKNQPFLKNLSSVQRVVRPSQRARRELQPGLDDHVPGVQCHPEWPGCPGAVAGGAGPAGAPRTTLATVAIPRAPHVWKERYRRRGGLALPAPPSGRCGMSQSAQPAVSTGEQVANVRRRRDRPASIASKTRLAWALLDADAAPDRVCRCLSALADDLPELHRCAARERC